MLRKRTWIIVLAAVGALVVILGGVGIAYAQRPDLPADSPFPFDGGLFGGEGILGNRHVGVAMHRGPGAGGPFQGGPIHSLVEVVAQETGLSEEQVVAALREGQTIAELAEAEGIEVQAIVDAALAEAEVRLAEAVEDGQLTEDQKEQILSRLAEELPERLEQYLPAGGVRGAVLGRFSDRFWTMYDAVADVLNLEPEALFTELHDGKTVEDVAEAQGVEMDEVRDAIEGARADLAEEALEQAVENGRLTEEQADWLLEGMEKGFLPQGRGFGHGRGAGAGRGRRGPGMGW